MHTADFTVFGLYLLIVLLIGVCAGAFRRTRRSDASYFLADRSMGWFPLGLSVMVTAFSAINFVAMPSEVFGHGLYVVASLPVFLLVAFPITRVLIPFFHDMRLTSAYEYLEHRFDDRARCLSSALFILWRVAWMSTALYASGTILAKVADIPPAAVIITAGIIAMLYTTLGGIRAVMWTDVLQFFVLVGGILAGLALAGQAVQSNPQALDTLFESNHLRPFFPFDPDFLSFDPRIRITLWSALLGTFVAFLTRYGADQVVVQRYFTGRSLRDIRRGFWLNIAAALFAISLLVLLGLATALWSTTQPPAPAEAKPLFHLAALFRALPAGLTGLVAAGLMAATMSSIDSGLNACCATYTTDFHKRLRPNAPAQSSIRNMLLTLATGAAVIAFAFQVGRMGELFAVVNRIIHGLGSPLLALFLLGMFSKRTGPRGAFFGGLAGTLFSIWICWTVNTLALHYYAVVNLAGTLIAARLISAILGETVSEQAQAWTWSARKALPSQS